jgi:hypothetical protein
MLSLYVLGAKIGKGSLNFTSRPNIKLNTHKLYILPL